jgi:hypothetical protein
MPHYMVDVYGPDSHGLNRRPSESFRVVASTDDEAIREARTHCSYRECIFFRVRIVARAGDRVIYDSRSAADA